MLPSGSAVALGFVGLLFVFAHPASLFRRNLDMDLIASILALAPSKASL
jgi:hypothetical protein